MLLEIALIFRLKSEIALEGFERILWVIILLLSISFSGIHLNLMIKEWNETPAMVRT